MSTQALRDIIGRAISDPAYREQLFADPAKALAGFELSEEEGAMLRALKRDQFDVLAAELEQRVSKSGLGILPLQHMEHPPVPMVRQTEPPELEVDVQRLIEALSGGGSGGDITPINLPNIK